MLNQPSIQCQANSTKHRNFEQITQQKKWTAKETRTKPRDKEVVGEGATKHCGDLEPEDDEPPEDNDMHPTRRLFASHKLFLPKAIDEKFLDPITDAVEAIDRGCGLQ